MSEQREPCRAGRSCPEWEGTLLSPEREEKGAYSKKGTALQGNLNSPVVKTGTHPSSTGAKLPVRYHTAAKHCHARQLPSSLRTPEQQHSDPMPEGN